MLFSNAIHLSIEHCELSRLDTDRGFFFLLLLMPTFLPIEGLFDVCMYVCRLVGWLVVFLTYLLATVLPR